jgi:hypothetical protein
MRLLLVGNGPAPDLAAQAAWATHIIQINKCVHAPALAGKPTIAVYMNNTGPVAREIAAALVALRETPGMAAATIVFARNPVLYWLKKAGMQLKRDGRWREYRLNRTAEATARAALPAERPGLLSSLWLELKLRRRGMPPSFQPSTGMVAYDEITAQLGPLGELRLAGFTFEGWEQHPWEIERELVKEVVLSPRLRFLKERMGEGVNPL